MWTLFWNATNNRKKNLCVLFSIKVIWYVTRRSPVDSQDCGSRFLNLFRNTFSCHGFHDLPVFCVQRLLFWSVFLSVVYGLFFRCWFLGFWVHSHLLLCLLILFTCVSFSSLFGTDGLIAFIFSCSLSIFLYMRWFAILPWVPCATKCFV